MADANSWHFSHRYVTFLADELGNFHLGTIGSHSFNYLSAKKQMTKFTSVNFQKMSGPSCIILIIQRLEGKSCRSR